MRAIGILWVNESLVLGLFRLFGRDGMDALQLARGADESAKWNVCLPGPQALLRSLMSICSIK